MKLKEKCRCICCKVKIQLTTDSKWNFLEIILINSETAPIIKQIFDLALDGMGNIRICKEQILIMRIQQNTDSDVKYYAWSGVRISTILRNLFEKVGRTDKDRRIKKEREPIGKAYYICQIYNCLCRNVRTNHKIKARDLYNFVLLDIQEIAAMALKDKEAFYCRLSRRVKKQYLLDTDSLKKEYGSPAQCSQEIDDTFISLYADKAKGILTEKRFLKLTDAMEKEQESNQNRM